MTHISILFIVRVSLLSLMYYFLFVFGMDQLLDLLGKSIYTSNHERLVMSGSIENVLDKLK